MSQTEQRFFRVFTQGVQWANLISERFSSRADAECYRQRLLASEPRMDSRIEEVDEKGRAIRK